MFPLPPHIYFELAALLCSILLWQRLRSSFFRFFIYYLVFIVVIELTGRYIRKVLHQPNVWLYNLSIPLEYLFYAFVFWKGFKIAAFRILAGWFIILFCIYTVFNLCFINGISTFASNNVTMGSFFMILFSLLFFYDLYINTETETVWKTPMFWIAAGVLLFNAGEFTYNLFSPFLITKGYDNTARMFSSINNKLIWVLYSFLIVAFLCKKPLGKSMKG